MKCQSCQEEKEVDQNEWCEECSNKLDMNCKESKMFVGGSGKLCPECKDNFEQYKDAVIEDRRHIK